MGAQEVELKLLQDYLQAALEAEDPKEMAQRIAVYEKQILTCKSQAVDFNISWCESMVFYLKAQLKLKAEGFFEKTLKATAQQSSGFDGLAPALLARDRGESRAREAVSLLDRAISLFDDPDYRFMRAALYMSLKDKRSALADAEHLLTHYADEQDTYLAARKLKDEIDTLKDGGCFIATAVYEPIEGAKIDILREYRDRVLLRSTMGKAFVSFYYAVSPNIAQVIAKSQMLKTMIRALLLDPIVKVVSNSQR